MTFATLRKVFANFAVILFNLLRKPHLGADTWEGNKKVTGTIAIIQKNNLIERYCTGNLFRCDQNLI